MNIVPGEIHHPRKNTPSNFFAFIPLPQPAPSSPMAPCANGKRLSGIVGWGGRISVDPRGTYVPIGETPSKILTSTPPSWCHCLGQRRHPQWGSGTTIPPKKSSGETKGFRPVGIYIPRGGTPSKILAGVTYQAGGHWEEVTACHRNVVVPNGT